MVWTASASQPSSGTPSICRSRRRDWKRFERRSSDSSSVVSADSFRISFRVVVHGNDAFLWNVDDGDSGGM